MNKLIIFSDSNRTSVSFELQLKQMTAKNSKVYWKTNLKYLVILLIIWFAVSFLFGIIMAETLNQFHIGGFPLGFWFAHQGAIYTFVILIFVYVYLMNRLDKKFDVDEI
jgi:putative solute:sodium symporter small subunit